MMENVSSETSVSFCKTVRRHIIQQFLLEFSAVLTL